MSIHSEEKGDHRGTAEGGCPISIRLPRWGFVPLKNYFRPHAFLDFVGVDVVLKGLVT